MRHYVNGSQLHYDPRALPFDLIQTGLRTGPLPILSFPALFHAQSLFRYSDGTMSLRRMSIGSGVTAGSGTYRVTSDALPSIGNAEDVTSGGNYLRIGAIWEIN